MKDQLDDFIQKNRPGFDDKEPSEKVWKNIESSLTFSAKRWLECGRVVACSCHYFYGIVGLFIDSEASDQIANV